MVGGLVGGIHIGFAQGFAACYAGGMAKRILVVEDEAAMQSLLRTALEDAGFAVLQATDGEQGLAVAEAERPNLILLDIIMTKMDGITMLKMMRGQRWGKKIPVIILTNLASSGRVAEALQDEDVDYLVKAEHRLDEVVARVKAKLGMR